MPRHLLIWVLVACGPAPRVDEREPIRTAPTAPATPTAPIAPTGADQRLRVSPDLRLPPARTRDAGSGHTIIVTPESLDRDPVLRRLRETAAEASFDDVQFAIPQDAGRDARP